ncbi:DoxX family membrane protein [Flavobacterium sp. FlaQc-50]|jgi:uncharacterized membrane protein YphA (DoxX/SURF4 family)|uniref:DoxX family membrane protein n=1 Tax=unclassified Flavobacterium TaxID=196869 RepID=UPI003756D072
MKKKILFGLRLLTGLIFIKAGLDKFFCYMLIPKKMLKEMEKVVKAFMETGWLMSLVGAVEIIEGVLLIPNRTRVFGVIVLLPVVTGILLANLNMSSSSLSIVFILIGIILWTIIDNKKKYLPLAG